MAAPIGRGLKPVGRVGQCQPAPQVAMAAPIGRGLKHACRHILAALPPQVAMAAPIGRGLKPGQDDEGEQVPTRRYGRPDW